MNSRIDKNGVKKWGKSCTIILSKFNERGVTIFSKKSIGVSISRVEKADEKNTVLFRLTTTVGTEIDVCLVYALLIKITYTKNITGITF